MLAVAIPVLLALLVVASVSAVCWLVCGLDNRSGGPVKRRYRWACLNGRWHWWSVRELARDDGSPGSILDYLP